MLTIVYNTQVNYNVIYDENIPFVDFLRLHTQEFHVDNIFHLLVVIMKPH